MNVRKRIAVLALIIIQVGTSMLMPLSHQHVQFSRNDSSERFQSHNCGAKEIHKPLDDIRHCLLCLRDLSSVAHLVYSSTVPKSCAQPITDCATSLTDSSREHFSEPDRGPPSFFA